MLDSDLQPKRSSSSRYQSDHRRVSLTWGFALSSRETQLTKQRDRALRECRQRNDLAESSFQDANQKMQEYLNMLARVMKLLNEANSAIIRNVQ